MQPKNVQADIRMTLRRGTSCKDAERALTPFLFPGRAAIVCRSGATEVYTPKGRFSHWREVSPASPEWMDDSVVRLHVVRG